MIRTETGSGTSLESRPELGIILDFIHPDETLVVTRIDRLARSLQDLQVIVAKITERGAHLAATEQPVDTSSATGKAFFDMLGVFAEFETNLAPGTPGRRNCRSQTEGHLSRSDLRRSTWKRSGADFSEGQSPTRIATRTGDLGAEPCTRRKGKAGKRDEADPIP